MNSRILPPGMTRQSSDTTIDDKANDRQGKLSPQSASPSHPQDTYRDIQPTRSIGKTLAFLLLVIFNLGANVTIILVSLIGFKLGAIIIQDHFPVSDNRAVTVVNTVAKVLSIFSVIIGGKAVSHIWSRRLSKAGSSAGLAELQSLTVFQSVVTIYHSIANLSTGKYISARWLYGAVIACAILLQVYSIAISGLMTPTLTKTPDSTLEQQIAPISYFETITGCSPNSDACLDIALSAKAISDTMAFDHPPWQWPFGDVSTPWLEADSTFYLPGLVVQAAFPVGPINGRNLSDGGVLWGVDLATILGITSIPERLFFPTPKSVWDANVFQVNASAQLPSLQCLCGLDSNNASHITIHNNQYSLPSPIDFGIGGGGEIVGRLTSDNNTLVLAFPPSPPPNITSSITYCAIQLYSDNMPLQIFGIPSTQFVSVDSTMRVFPNPSDVSQLSSLLPRNASIPPIPLPPFATRWLRGLGWGNQPVPSPIVDILQQYEIGTDSDNGVQPTKMFLEHFILAMVANGVSASFSDLLLEDGIQTASPSSGPPAPRSIQFDITKTQYYIGGRGAFQWFFLVIVILDTVFVVICSAIILWDGWYPDFSDPVTLTQVALSSSPPSNPGLHTDQSNIGRPAQSPVALQYCTKKQADPLWKEGFSLVESEGGGFVMFRPQTS
ncbi:hypothetical protein NLI96_g8296 [Meripilus lineatus]|uniref:Uncharacterized protein n=1 Tax=Meripilus lineatus TaxID=2056292 RepID=A0AAD5YC52_9APHY|nr:hypothetical protein NLI96_g8296 [Physisporinus lineatus]